MITTERLTDLQLDGHGVPGKQARPGEAVALCLPHPIAGWVPVRAEIATTERLACGCDQVTVVPDYDWPSDLFVAYPDGATISPHVQEERATYAAARRAAGVLDEIAGVLEDHWDRTEGASDENREAALEATLELVRAGVLPQVAPPRMAAIAESEAA